jgi:hypothetical protein
MKEMIPQPLAFFVTAPLIVRDSVEAKASPSRVFEAFADVTSWPKWYPLMHRTSWISGSGGLGSEREVRLRLLGVFREKFIAWEEGARFAFTMTASTSPLASAISEDFALVKLPSGGTRIDWTLAAEPTAVGRALTPALKAIMRGLLARSGAGLDRYLS